MLWLTSVATASATGSAAASSGAAALAALLCPLPITASTLLKIQRVSVRLCNWLVKRPKNVTFWSVICRTIMAY